MEGSDAPPNLPDELAAALDDALDGATAGFWPEVEALCGRHPRWAARLREEAQRRERFKAGERTLPTPDRAPVPEPPPSQIGPYRILERVGLGGMGEVFKAEQRTPSRRLVALKVIKQGMATKEVLARFRLEQKALASMSHGAIAKVFDAGATEKGEPYFVMEYVEGSPITAYCDKHKLSLPERIAIFQQICAGMQHAHQKGFVHRDLKPGNVLVAREGDAAVPKILDFGLAKAMSRDAIDVTFFTEQDRVMGTYEYMAPEQAAGEGEAIDARTDIYALGVMLYELLTGTLPFPGLREAKENEKLRRIQEEEPGKPSTRLSGDTQATSDVAARRRTSLPALRRALRGDLDWVVLKAMAKEPERRYESAAALAADLGRYLAHEPVLAGPPTVGYRLRKFARRYRVQLLAAGMVFAAVVWALVVSVVSMLRARDSEMRAVASAAEANRQEGIAHEQARAADNARAGEAAKAKEAAENAATAQRNAERAERSAAEALARKAAFDHKQAIANEKELHPPWPHKIEAMERWLRDDAEKLLSMRPAIEQTVTDLRARALPATDAEREQDRTTHPRFAEWRTHAAKLASLERAQSIRTNAQKLTLPFATAEEQAMAPDQLNGLACPRVDFDEAERIWGEERRALVLAQLAWEKAKDLADGERASFGDTLAWAWFANGRDDAALAQSESALALAPADKKGEYEGYLATLRAKVAAATGEAGAKALADLRTTVAALEAEVTERRTYRFAEESHGFLHGVLVDLLGKLGSLESKERKAVNERLRWARQVSALTVGHPKARVTWQQAREAIAKADGVVASELYRGKAIELREQDVLGLVPIGMNPATRLWEFYDLRSAWDGSRDPAAIEIPRHLEDRERAGYIEVSDGTGIVFVLLPGGSFTMGSQDHDPGAPNYDPQRESDQGLREVELSPFFLARHELTQGQWKRLSGGETPSYYREGSAPGGGPRITWSNPVEQVDWNMCVGLLGRHGMLLPTDAQWEYGCRAGTTTPWLCALEDLVRYANVADATLKRATPEWTCEEWGDGHVVHAPVGSFLANAFGLFDVHGNVLEWTRDGEHGPGAYAAGDGLRGDPGSSAWHAHRGGGFVGTARGARSALLMWSAPSFRRLVLGARPARASRLDDLTTSRRR